MSTLCVGRETEIEKLLKYFSLASSGDFQICFVSGEAGSGKTTLINKFVEVIEKEYPESIIAIGECSSFTGISNPYLPFREVLSMLTGDIENKVSRGSVSRQTSENIKNFLITSIETVLELGPDLIGDLLPGGTLIARGLKVFSEKSDVMKKLRSKNSSSSIRLDLTEVNEDAIFQQFTKVLSSLSEKRSLLVILDDLHWADNASISLLFHLLRKLKGSRILILGTYRTNEILGVGESARHPLSTLINEARRYQGDIVIDLGSQSKLYYWNFVNLIIDLEPNLLNEEFRQKVFSLTEGNALFTTEMLRNLKESGGLVLDEKGRWIEGADLNWNDIPAKVEGVIEERIARLEKQLREELSIASVEGENFTAQVISRLISLNEGSVLRNLNNELEKKHKLVVESGEIKVGTTVLSLYRFGHSLIQQYLYNDLGRSERRILHKQVAETLESLYQDQVDVIAAQLARHYEEAGDIEKASVYLMKSAELALRMSAFTDAKKNLLRALALGVPDIALLIRLHRYLGNAHYGLSDYDFARQDFFKGREYALSVGDKVSQAQIENELGRSMLELDISRDEPKKLFESSLQLSKALGDLDVQVRSLSELGAVYSYEGQLTLAKSYLEESLELANKNQKGIFIYTYYDLGCCLRTMGELASAKRVLIDGVSLCKERGNREVEGYCWTELGYTYYDSKDYEGARSSFDTALAIGRDINNKWNLAEAFNGLGFIACDMDELPLAYKYFKDALEIYYGKKIYTGFLLTLIGFAYYFARTEKYSDSLEMIGLSMGHPSATSDVKQQANRALDFIRQKNISEETIRRHIIFGSGKTIDAVIKSLLD